MAQLGKKEGEDMKHIHSVYDTDSHFSIDPITRAIKNESSKKTTVMQYDHNSERFTFEMPREIEGHDMTLCNKVELHYINIASDQSGQSKGVYPIDDLQTSPEDDKVVICSWLISKKATKYAGTLSFRLRFACIDENAKVVYAWHTEIFKNISISNGIDNAEAVHEEYSDILEAWKQNIDALAVKIDEHEMDSAENIDALTVKLNEHEMVSAENNLRLEQLIKSNAETIDKLKKYHTTVEFRIDSSIKYIKTVPRGVLPTAEIVSIGGYSYRNSAMNGFNSYKVSKFVSRAKDGTVIDEFVVPDGIYSSSYNGACYGDGWYVSGYWDDAAKEYVSSAYKRNEVNFRNRKFTYFVRRIELDGVNIKFARFTPTHNNRGLLSLPFMATNAESIDAEINEQVHNYACSHFNTDKTVWGDHKDNKGCFANNETLWIRFGSDSEINTLEKANQYLKDQKAAGTPVTILYIQSFSYNIYYPSSINTDGRFIKVVEGGTITAENEFKKAVPFTVEYEKETWNEVTNTEVT